MPYFEDVEIGSTVEVGSYTFTRENIRSFASRFDPQPFHLEEEAARRSVFGGLAASGWHTASAFMRCWVSYAQREQAGAEARGETVVSNGPSPGFQNLRWLRPVLAGDTLSYSSKVTSKRRSASQPRWGLVFSKITGVNQRGEVAFSFESSIFTPCRDSA
jgi:acyl dehydratase